MATDEPRWPMRRQQVLELLEDGEWHSTAEINSAETGGTEGTRRVRELRAFGYAVEKRKMAESTQYEYRLGHADKSVHTWDVWQ